MIKYVGNKNFSNVVCQIINNIPKSKRYFSLFYGAGGIEKSDYTSEAFFICSEKNPENKKYEDSMKARIEYFDYKDLIEDNVFTSEDFIFADPPYMFSTRSSGRKYYKFEFNTKEHIEFLNYMISLNAKILITHPVCTLYSEKLKGWRIEELKYMTHNGMYHDAIWCNYDRADIDLLNYDALGNNFTDRQRIKRQRENVINKFKNLDIHVRKAIVKELKKENLL